MDEILITLGTISQINRGDKLRVKGKNIDIDKRYGQFLWRFFDNEGKESTKEYLTTIYNEIKRRTEKSLSYIQRKKLPADPEYVDECKNLKNIANALGKSFYGIKNLKNTYADCSSMISALNYIIDYVIRPLYLDIFAILKTDGKYTPMKFDFDSENDAKT